MMLPNIAVIAMSASILFVSPSHAASTDFIDNGIFTTDTLSGLDWLDVTTSMNQSFSYVSTQFGVGGDYEGYRYATSDEFNIMVVNYTGNPTINDGSPVNQETDLIDGLVDLLGNTEIGNVIQGPFPVDIRYTLGILADIHTDLSIINTFRHTTGYILDDDRSVDLWDLTWNHFDGLRHNPQEGYIGSYLVRESTLVATPVPAAVFLFAPALLGFLGFHRKSLKVTKKV